MLEEVLIECKKWIDENACDLYECYYMYFTQYLPILLSMNNYI